MLIWVEGGLNSDEIKRRIIDNGDVEFRDRLLAFLDDCISNGLIDDSDPQRTFSFLDHHPCSIRGVPCDLPDDLKSIARAKDLRNLINSCQRHKHTSTCFKYWKGPPDPKECRFDLDESHHHAVSNSVYTVVFIHDIITIVLSARCMKSLKSILIIIMHDCCGACHA